jgi:ABC-2 type transport system ATP-binding protein
MNEIIITEKLSKQYKDVNAVSEISLNVRKGEIYGFLGLNGAGKTTTIRMLLGMIKPGSGSAYIDGIKVKCGNTPIWEKVGYLVEIPYSYPELTVRENLEIVRRLRFLKNKSSVDEIIRLLQLEPYENRKAKNLSLGNAQRLGLAKALIHKPQILILDEPANGLDPAGIFEIRELLTGMALNQGVTIFISSHILSEIAKFATRIGIIHNGKLIQEIDSSELNTQCKKSLLINATNSKAARLVLAQAGYLFRANEDGILECLHPDAVNHPDRIASILVNAGCPPTLLQVSEEDLESYFLRTIEMNTCNEN